MNAPLFIRNERFSPVTVSGLFFTRHFKTERVVTAWPSSSFAVWKQQQRLFVPQLQGMLYPDLPLSPWERTLPERQSYRKGDGGSAC